MSIELHPWRGHGDVEAADALVLHAPVRRGEHHRPLRLVRVRDLMIAVIYQIVWQKTFHDFLVCIMILASYVLLNKWNQKINCSLQITKILNT